MSYFSIIIPVYKCEKYISRCINSVIEQSFKDFELILVIDDIFDNSYKICNDYKKLDSRIKVLFQKHSGVSATRNTGLKNSTGKYIIFLDSDDIFFNNYTLEKIYNKSLSTNYDMYIYGYIDSNGKKHDNYSLFLNEKNGNVMLDHSLQLNHSIPCTIWRCIFKSSSISQLYFNEQYEYGEDVDFIFRVTKQLHTFQFVNEYIIVYTTSNTESITHNLTIDKIQNCINMLKYHYNYYKELSHKQNHVKILEYIANRYCNMLVRAFLVDKSNNQNIANSLIDKEIIKNSAGIIYMGTKIIWKLLGYKIGSKFIGNIFFVYKNFSFRKITHNKYY